MATKFLSKERWFVRYKDSNGIWRQKYLGKSRIGKDGKGISASEAEKIRKIYDGKELNRKWGVVIRDINSTIEDAIEEFKKDSLFIGKTAYNLSSGSIKTYKNNMGSLKRWFQSKNIKGFSDLSIEKIEGFSKDINHLRQNTAIDLQRLLIRFLRWSDKRGYWDKSKYLDDIKRVKKEKKQPKFLSIEEIHNVYDNVDKFYKNAVKFMYLTGSRCSDVGIIKWKNFNPFMNNLTFEKSGNTKTKEDRTVAIHTEVVNIIKEQREIVSVDSEYIFTNKQGRKLTGKVLSEVIKKAFDKLGIKATSHILRHSFASHLASKGVSLGIIKDLLRHSDISMTQIYAHISNDSQRQSLSLLSI